MRIVRSKWMAVIVVATFVLGIGIARVSGAWNTQSSRVPMRYSSGAFSGEYNPADIRGSYAFADIEAAFGIPAELLAEAFGMAEVDDPGSIRANSLEAIYAVQPDGGEVGTDSLRLFTSMYTGLPYTPEPTTRLPTPAIDVLESRLAPADVDALRAISVSVADLSVEFDDLHQEATTDDEEESGLANGGVGAQEAPVEHDEDARIVRGKTTFNDLLDWGLTEDQIEEATGMPMGTRATTVRDHVVGNGGEFSSSRERLQELLN